MLLIQSNAIDNLCSANRNAQNEEKKLMKILALAKILPDGTPEKIQQYLKPETAKAWEFYNAGVIREWYIRTDFPSAVLMLECATVEAAREVLTELPMVEDSLIDFDLIPLGPFDCLPVLFAHD
jgi:hypothetical protein